MNLRKNVCLILLIAVFTVLLSGCGGAQQNTTLNAQETKESAPATETASVEAESVTTEETEQQIEEKTWTFYVASEYREDKKNTAYGDYTQLTQYGFREDGVPEWTLSGRLEPGETSINVEDYSKEFFLYNYAFAEDASKQYILGEDDYLDKYTEEEWMEIYADYLDMMMNPEAYDPFEILELGMEENGCVVYQHVLGAFGMVRTFNGKNQCIQKDYYHAGSLLTSTKLMYDEDNSLKRFKISHMFGNSTADGEIEYLHNGREAIITRYSYEGAQKPKNAPQQTAVVKYDDNGMMTDLIWDGGEENHVTYQFTRMVVSDARKDFLVNLYSSLQIPFYIAEEEVKPNNQLLF